MTATANETMANMTTSLGELRMAGTGNTTTNGTTTSMDMDMPVIDAANSTDAGNETAAMVNGTRAGNNRTAAGGNTVTAASRRSRQQPKRHFLFF